MTIETVKFCPLGKKCEEIKDGKMYKCGWLVKLAGTNPQTGENIDEEACAIKWLPLLLVENTRTNHGVSANIEVMNNAIMIASMKAIDKQAQPNGLLKKAKRSFYDFNN